MLDAQALFQNLLKLVGRQVELSTPEAAKPLKGRISNVMFDSFILDTDTGRRIVRFEDIVFLNPIG